MSDLSEIDHHNNRQVWNGTVNYALAVSMNGYTKNTTK